jgi:hypothetical protein
MQNLNDERYKSTLAFVDLLFNILVGFIMLFLIAFLLINPVSKKKDVESQSRFLIIMTWSDKSASDIDLWVKLPDGCFVGFSHKECGVVHLDRDDLGHTNDTTVNIDGKQILVNKNTETISIRGPLVGRLYVSAHFYRRAENTDPKGQPIEIQVKLVKVTPYTEIYNVKKVLLAEGDEAFIPTFEITSEGKIVDIHDTKVSAVPTSSVNATRDIPNPTTPPTTPQNFWNQIPGR